MEIGGLFLGSEDDRARRTDAFLVKILFVIRLRTRDSATSWHFVNGMCQDSSLIERRSDEVEFRLVGI